VGSAGARRRPRGVARQWSGSVRTIGDIRELRDGIRWLIRLRMVAIVGVIATTLVAQYVLRLKIYYPGLYGVTGFLFVYNVVFAILFRRMQQKIWPTRVIANMQIFLDFLSLTVLLHYSGGIANPFIFYYVFHMIVSAILLTRVEAAIQTFLAILMFSTMFLFERYGLIRHWSLGIGPDMSADLAPIYSFGTYFVLVSTLLLAMYMTISISERSRRKNIEISTIREQLSRHELPRVEEELLREEKLRSLGRMSAGIAHEINNPLTVVLTNIELVLDDLKPGNPDRETLEIAKEEVLRCREIIGHLLTFSRGVSAGRKICDAGEVLSESVALIENYAKVNRVKVDREIAREEIYCRINEDQIKQVLVNVMMNGIQAMPEGGHLDIRLSQEEGQYVEFAVEDTGHGIPRTVLRKIFDPFFTTKGTGGGTGLGLSVCHKLVEDHHGVMVVSSEENKGTRVQVRLPCVH
jgi:signal transduction histidine kinase